MKVGEPPEDKQSSAAGASKGSGEALGEEGRGGAIESKGPQRWKRACNGDAEQKAKKRKQKKMFGVEAMGAGKRRR